MLTCRRAAAGAARSMGDANRRRERHVENGRQWAAAVLAVAVTGLGAIGCDGEGGRGEIVYDTIGGVPAVLNPAEGLRGDSLAWTFTEHLRAGPDQLYERTPATYALDVGVLPDGGVAVLDAGNRRALWFGLDGDYLRAVGSEGEGPGEFRNPFMLEVADTLVYVLDIALNRVSAFDAAGTFLRSFTIDLGGLAGTTPLFQAGAPDEVYVAGEPVPFGMAQVRDTGRAVIYRMDATGAIADTLLAFAPSDWTPIQLPGGRGTFVKARFAPEPRVAARPSLAAAAYLAPYVIEYRRSDGEPVRRVTRRYENRPVVQSVRDSILERLASGPNRLPREALSAIPFEPEIPAIEGLVLDDRGRLWVDPYIPEEPNRHDVFDAEGRYLGPAYLPRPVQLKDVRGDRACGVIPNPDDRSAETICYRFTAPEPEDAAES
jgi:hypothetical protein